MAMLRNNQMVILGWWESMVESLFQWEFQDPKLEVPTIYKAYFSGLCKGISPQNMAKNMVQYLHFRILKFPLIILDVVQPEALPWTTSANTFLGFAPITDDGGPVWWIGAAISLDFYARNWRGIEWDYDGILVVNYNIMGLEYNGNLMGLEL